MPHGIGYGKKARQPKRSLGRAKRGSMKQVIRQVAEQRASRQTSGSLAARRQSAVRSASTRRS